jgi:hypothetical protein
MFQRPGQESSSRFRHLGILIVSFFESAICHPIMFRDDELVRRCSGRCLILERGHIQYYYRPWKLDSLYESCSRPEIHDFLTCQEIGLSIKRLLMPVTLPTLQIPLSEARVPDHEISLSRMAETGLASQTRLPCWMLCLL